MPCSGFSLTLNLIQPPTNHLILRDLHPLQINIPLTKLGNPRCQPHPGPRSVAEFALEFCTLEHSSHHSSTLIFCYQ
ncbi:hypothetical protein SKAU_G00059800 [Synaphobranchus kaupii]|uniref:Uncharacterized protein n=1 Tax=Synaphobranchus kaupii TaxID=118154 RepID=A0A9Q1G4T2_SYNKA|nr:hypothetical protein SKAU_G00059800 [Synaphobranchus kaupii]